MRFASLEDTADRRAAVTADDAGGAANGALDHGIRESHVVHITIQHAEEARVVGEGGREVRDRMAAAVEVDAVVVGRREVERDPVDAFHVDVGLHAEIDLGPGDQQLGHLQHVRRRVEVVRIVLGAGTGIRGHIGPLDEHIGIRGRGALPVVGTDHLVDGDGNHVDDVFFHAGSRNLEFGRGGCLAVAGHQHLVGRELIRRTRAHLVVGAVGAVVRSGAVRVDLQRQVEDEVRNRFGIGLHVHGLALAGDDLDDFFKVRGAGVEHALHLRNGRLRLLFAAGGEGQREGKEKEIGYNSFHVAGPFRISNRHSSPGSG